MNFKLLGASVLSISVFAGFELSALAQFEVGNGGDAVVCDPAAGSPFDGVYALDWLLTYRVSNANGDIVDLPLGEGLARLERLLSEKVPSLAPSFKSFRKDLLNTVDATRPHLWEEAPFGLIDLKDEQIVALVPANCRDGDKIRVIQAVIRQDPGISGTPPGTTLYKYVPEVVDSLTERSPVQLSFLLVHEWLWDVSDKVDRNRRVNRFLHSRALDELSPAAVVAQLRGLGLTVPDAPPPPPPPPPPDDTDPSGCKTRPDYDLVEPLKARPQTLVWASAAVDPCRGEVGVAWSEGDSALPLDQGVRLYFSVLDKTGTFAFPPIYLADASKARVFFDRDRYVVGWSDFRQAHGCGINASRCGALYLRSFDTRGKEIYGERRVHEGVLVSYLRAAPDSNGDGYLFTFVRDLKRDIFAARVSASGELKFLLQVNEEPTPTVHSEAYSPSAYADKNGGWVAVYSDRRTSSGSDQAFARRLDADGVPGPEKSFGYGSQPVALPTADGGMFLGISASNRLLRLEADWSVRTSRTTAGGGSATRFLRDGDGLLTFEGYTGKIARYDEWLRPQTEGDAFTDSNAASDAEVARVADHLVWRILVSGSVGIRQRLVIGVTSLP